MNLKHSFSLLYEYEGKKRQIWKQRTSNKKDNLLTQVANESGPNGARWSIEMACGIVDQLHWGGILMGGNA